MSRNVIILTVIISAYSFVTHAQDTPVVISDIRSLAQYTNKTITITGTISAVLWAHITAPPKGYPVIEYLDSENFQTVLYLKQKTKCSGSVRITGKVIKITGASSPGDSSLKSKAEGITEYHIVVDTYECLE